MWKPKYSGNKMFKEAIIKTIDWYKNPINLKSFKNVNKFTL